jgi:hypothetical protein
VKWISVEDELPEAFYALMGSDPVWSAPYVLVVIPGVMSFILIAYYDDESGEWHSDDRINPIKGITHWMPLPDPPNEEEKIIIDAADVEIPPLDAQKIIRVDIFSDDGETVERIATWSKEEDDRERES